MTPHDIQNKRFEKSMSGYRVEEVHTFLNYIAEHVQQLEDYNDDLLRKMEVLADKLEQYREDEDSLRAALIGAQKLGDSVVRESKRKAEAILAGASRKAEEMVADAQMNIDHEAFALSKMQKEVASFKKQIISLYTQHLKMIESIPYDDETPPRAPEIKYTPPQAHSVSYGVADEEGGEDIVVSFEKIDAKLNDEQNSQDADDTKSYAKKTVRYDKLSDFFGEDKPVERE